MTKILRRQWTATSRVRKLLPALARKLDVMADRVRAGYPLWHESDRADYTGLTGAVRPRD